jgi:hypothetical protein
MGNEKKSAKIKSQLGAFVDPAEEVTEAQEAQEQEAQEQTTAKEQPPTNTEVLLQAIQALQAEVKSLKEEKTTREQQERKTKRVNLLTKPSVFAKATEAAKKEQVSFNEFAERALLAYAEQVLGK